MSEAIVERQALIEVVNTLPDEALVELASFLDYLRYKADQDRASTIPERNFLLAIAGLGSSGQQGISESASAK
jgi:hypothetical protein